MTATTPTSLATETTPSGVVPAVAVGAGLVAGTLIARRQLRIADPVLDPAGQADAPGRDARRAGSAERAAAAVA